MGTNSQKEKKNRKTKICARDAHRKSPIGPDGTEGFCACLGYIAYPKCAEGVYTAGAKLEEQRKKEIKNGERGR